MAILYITFKAIKRKFKMNQDSEDFNPEIFVRNLKYCLVVAAMLAIAIGMILFSNR